MKQLSQFINEAKATYCGRCDTTHVPPAKGGTCPAVKEEQEEHLPWHEDPKNPTRKVGVRKDQYGNVIKNVPKYLAKKAMQTNEEADQIDELSKATSASYTKKAARSIAGLAANAAARAALHGKASEYDKRTLRNRITGVSRATDRMTKEETLKTLSQFIEEANNNLFEADQIKAHHERVKKLKGKKVSFTHPVSKQKITGTMQKIVQMGGLPYAHVETGKSAHRVPVHQID